MLSDGSEALISITRIDLSGHASQDSEFVDGLGLSQPLSHMVRPFRVLVVTKSRVMDGSQLSAGDCSCALATVTVPIPFVDM